MEESHNLRFILSSMKTVVKALYYKSTSKSDTTLHPSYMKDVKTVGSHRIYNKVIQPLFQTIVSFCCIVAYIM